MPQLTDSLLREARLAAIKHNRLKALVTEAVFARYGHWPRKVEYDDLIGSDNNGRVQRVVKCDLTMSAYGCFPKEATNEQ